MNPLASVMTGVEAAIASGDAHRRATTLHRLTTLFVEQAPGLGDEHVAVFDEVIHRLSLGLEIRARVELAERLADLPNAPYRTVRALAFDDSIQVAQPVIARSSRLDEGDLVAIAAVTSQAHLLAMSCRAALPERVTEVLVDRGDALVVRSVAINAGARFSDRGLAAMVERARADRTLQDLLRARADLPDHHLTTLIAIARGLTHERLAAAFGPGAEPAVGRAVARAADGLRDDRASAQALVKGSMAAVEVLTEDEVTHLVKTGRLREALAAMADLAKVPLDVVVTAYEAPTHDPLLFVVKSLRFGWVTFKLLLTEKLGEPLPEGAQKSAFESYQRLSVQTAQRVVQYGARERRG